MKNSLVKTVSISLKTSADVKNFVNVIAKYPYDIDLRSGRYTVDAKSILGIFSLDLSKPIEMDVMSADCDDIIAELKSFLL